MLGIASAARFYSRNRERGETPKQKHSLLRQEHDRGKDRERGEIRRNTQANTLSKNTRSYRKQITVAQRNN